MFLHITKYDFPKINSLEKLAKRINNSLIKILTMGFPYPYPLGLPRGSVRASITLIYLGLLTYFVLLGDPLYEKLATSVSVMVAFYFDGRIRGTMSSGVAGSGERAFGLPPKTIRTIVLLDILLLWVYTYYFEGYIPPFLNELLIIILGYISGTLFFEIKRLVFKPSKTPSANSWIDHLKACVILGFSILFAGTLLTGFAGASDEWLFNTSYVLAGFYYGERREIHSEE